MAASTTPIFPLTPNTPVGNTIATANTAKDGTGTVVTIFTAGANGAKDVWIMARAIGTNVATVLRVFLNNGSTNATPGNNALIYEYTLAATTLSEVAAQPPYAFALPFAIPAGYKLLCTIGTTVAAGYALTAFGADY